MCISSRQQAIHEMLLRKARQKGHGDHPCINVARERAKLSLAQNHVDHDVMLLLPLAFGIFVQLELRPQVAHSIA